MTERCRTEERDEVLFAFHVACEDPTPEFVEEWVRKYPAYETDFRAHAGILARRLLEAQEPALEPDETMLARGRSRALNAIYNSEVDGIIHQSGRPASAAQPVDERASSRRLPRLERSRFETALVNVSLVGSAPCGALLLAEENLMATIPVPAAAMRPGRVHFLLQARGDSMTEAGIEDGCLVLVRQQDHADDKDIVVALVDDEATIKELRRSGDAVSLVPKSSNSTHRTIELRRDFLVQGVAIATLPDEPIDHSE